jgi:hypothetical protein
MGFSSMREHFLNEKFKCLGWNLRIPSAASGIKTVGKRLSVIGFAMKFTSQPLAKRMNREAE